MEIEILKQKFAVCKIKDSSEINFEDDFLFVGKTEEELKASGTSYHVQKLPMAYSGRFVAENETGNGLCKLILDEEDRIIGCHLLGNPASEIIVVAGIAVQYGYTVEEFQKTVFPHPTVGEIYHETLFA